ncbi:MAG: putative sporulation protein YtxC [Clostridia bacterium]|nr:putative sporulation protein YtxC [Clostridia bacterium]
MNFSAEVVLPENININSFSKEVSTEIIKRFENSIIYKILEKDFPLIPIEDKKEIYSMAVKKATESSDDIISKIHFNRRLALIEQEVKKYFLENDHMVIEGFVNFRLKDYKDELRELCLSAAEELSSLREYDEFIDMLKFFVSVQSPKEELVNIVKKNSRMRILNRRRKDITDLYFDDLVKSEEPLTDEDIILSELISIAPEKIVIHDSSEKEKIYETISKIFENVVYTK